METETEKEQTNEQIFLNKYIKRKLDNPYPPPPPPQKKIHRTPAFTSN